MKTLTRVALMMSMLSMLTLPDFAQACSTVQTANTTTAASSVNLALLSNSTQADMKSFQVAAGGNHIDTLILGPRSESGLVLSATVTQGSLTATCQFPMPGCFNTALTISVGNQICTQAAPVTVEDEACKHDNGNHWGEYRKLGMNNVPPHSGKPNMTKPCKTKTPPTTTPPPPPPTTCVPQLICSFTPHE